MPLLASHVWNHFVEIAATRQSNGMAISRLTRAEIRQWEQDEFVSLDPWERNAIMRLDAAFVASTEPEATSPIEELQ